MNVYVDLAPVLASSDKCYEPQQFGNKPAKAVDIPKRSRHYEASHVVFNIPHPSTEQAVIAALLLNVKLGLILAKAARIASIARPTEDLTSHYGLQEDTHADDFITSYLLKICPMKLLSRHKKSEECDWHCVSINDCRWMKVERDSVSDSTIRIYHRLTADLEEVNFMVL